MRRKTAKTSRNCKDGINLGKIDSCYPFMYADTPTGIEFVTANYAAHMIDNVIDTFGRNIDITDMGDGNYKFALTATPRSMRFWLLQYGKYVKILSPQSLVDQIRSDIAEMSKLYN